ncbi:DUF302 domain-containing protein [Rhodobacteraceae bacterium]|nr:DUF302 domain-containing protein [Paracoccaceae bacterium]
MRGLIAAIGLMIMTTTTAQADYVRVEAQGSVQEVSDRLVAAVENAGARVFARVPHSKGAASVDMALEDAELVIFGNPKLGTPALQADIHAGLVLPLRVLVYDDNGQTVLTYESIDALFDGMNIPADAPFRGAMSGALSKLTGAAAGS